MRALRSPISGRWDGGRYDFAMSAVRETRKRSRFKYGRRCNPIATTVCLCQTGRVAASFEGKRIAADRNQRIYQSTQHSIAPLAAPASDAQRAEQAIER